MQKIHQVELTNYCNLKCTYCPLSISTRPKGFMDRKVFIKVLNHIEKTGQKLLVLHNFGEPLLHPQLEDFIFLASQRGFIPGFSSNGLLLTEKKFIDLIHAGLRWMGISLHDKKALDIFYQMLPIAKKEGCILFARNFVDNSFHIGNQAITLTAQKHDFAGTAPSKINHEKTSKAYLNCDYINYDYFVVLYDGTITACCMDEQGITQLGNIDEIDKISHKDKYQLCNDCYGVRFYDRFMLQEKGFKICESIGHYSFCMRFITNKLVQKIFLATNSTNFH